MKIINIVNYTNNLLASILSLIIGVILFTRPDLVIIIISYILGGILVLIGIIKIIYYSYQKGKNKEFPMNDLLWAIIFVVLGGICIFLSDAVEQFVRFLIGGWILFSGINRLIKVTEIKNKSGSKFVSTLVSSLLLIAIGLYVIFKSNIFIQYLGIVLIVYSILEIINYIFIVRNSDEIIIEKNNNKKEKINIIETEEIKKIDKKDK